MKEEWKPVIGYEGRYEISNYGRLKRLFKGERILKNSFSGGYKRHSLFKDKKGVKCFIHRLVAQAFIPNPENKPFINHKDFNRANNNVSNLEWCTSKENTVHCVVNGRQNHPKVWGEKHSQAKLKTEDILFIRNYNYKKTKSKKQIMDRFNISISHLNLILRKGTWKKL